MGRPKKEQSEETEIKEEAVEYNEPKVVESKSQPKQLSSVQAFDTLGGNYRLKTYIEKKFKGVKSLKDWEVEFKKENLL